MAPNSRLNRRDFLKICSAQAATLFLPAALTGKQFKLATSSWPGLDAAEIPGRLQDILRIVPPVYLDEQGLVRIHRPEKGDSPRVPLAPTQFNRENSRDWHRLVPWLPWGIVLHWYGDHEGYDRTIRGYLRGFDSLRDINGDLIPTSAHFLVGMEDPLTSNSLSGRTIAYLQTQAPSSDGTPYMASHLQSLDYLGFSKGEQYFVKAQDLLTRQHPQNQHLLQEMYRGAQIDPNRRTIGIEIVGHHFDRADSFPGDQQIANVLGLVRAVMKRYRIPAKAIMGHHELQLGKPDPGKIFLSLIRYLIGVLASTSSDENFRDLVFGSYTSSQENPDWGLRRYFKFVRDYLTLTSTPQSVYNWERRSKYWLLTAALPGAPRNLGTVKKFSTPLEGKTSVLGDIFLRPESHEGVDLYAGIYNRHSSTRPVRLIADGICLYAGPARGYHGGNRAIFRHLQPDGAEILSIYSHLRKLPELKTGIRYPAEYRLGFTESPGELHDPFLHFALGYGASWEISLHNQPGVPLNAGTTWIRQHFLDPLRYDFERFEVSTDKRHHPILFD